MKRITAEMEDQWMRNIGLIVGLAWLVFSLYLFTYWANNEARLAKILEITQAQYVASEVVVTVKANDSIFGESRRCKLTYETANGHTLTLFRDESECRNVPPVITIP